MMMRQNIIVFQDDNDDNNDDLSDPFLWTGDVLAKVSLFNDNVLRVSFIRLIALCYTWLIFSMRSSCRFEWHCCPAYLYLCSHLCPVFKFICLKGLFRDVNDMQQHKIQTNNMSNSFRPKCPIFTFSYIQYKVAMKEIHFW